MLVQGGTMFPEATSVRLEGATADGSALKMGWILVGLRFEMSLGPKRITSSRVRSVAIEGSLEGIRQSPQPAIVSVAEDCRSASI